MLVPGEVVHASTGPELTAIWLEDGLAWRCGWAAVVSDEDGYGQLLEAVLVTRSIGSACFVSGRMASGR